MNRKQRRALDRASPAEKAMANKVAMFGELPSMCTACHKDFDKTDREMVSSWSVVVREANKTVRLFCPECIDKTRDALKETENVD